MSSRVPELVYLFGIAAALTDPWPSENGLLDFRGRDGSSSLMTVLLESADEGY